STNDNVGRQPVLSANGRHPVTDARRHILIAGCGYVGRRLYARLAERFDVTALVRTAHSASMLAAEGFRTATLDLDRIRAGASVPERLEQESTVYLVPPPAFGESDLRLDRFLQLVTVPPKSFVYVSTTGVYGDTGGATVEASAPGHSSAHPERRRVSADD